MKAGAWNPHPGDWMDDKQLASAAFLLGSKIGMKVAREGAHPFELLHEIAEGRLTLRDSPADMVAPYPDMDPALKEGMLQNANLLVQREREAARLVWEAFTDPLPGP